MKSARESIRDFNYAWADLLRALAEMLNDTADTFEVRAMFDEGQEITEMLFPRIDEEKHD